MKYGGMVAALLIAFVLLFMFAEEALAPHMYQDNNSMPPRSTSMKLTSSAFDNGGVIPRTYTCDGANINPPLIIEGVPSGTQSLVLIMDDHDVPRSIRPDGVWDHWVVFNIKPTTTMIRAGEEPQGVHGSGSGGKDTYQGPCPPDREHRYVFRLYALDRELVLETGASKSEVIDTINGHILATAELVGRYDRIR